MVRLNVRSRFILVPPSKASAIVLAIGVTLSSFMLGETESTIKLRMLFGAVRTAW